MKPKPKFKGKAKKFGKKGASKGPKTPKIPKQFQQNPLITYSKKEITETLDKFPGLMKTLGHAYDVQIKYTEEYSLFPYESQIGKKQYYENNQESASDNSKKLDETSDLESTSDHNQTLDETSDLESVKDTTEASDEESVKDTTEAADEESVEVADDYWFCNDMTTAVILMKYLDQFPGRVEWNQKPFSL